MTNLYSRWKHRLSALKYGFLALLSLLITTYLPAQPVISSFSPTSGSIGTTVTINGTGFSAKASENIVYLGKARATVLSASATSIKVTVPAAATYHPITVTSNRLTAYSARPFLVTAPGPYNGFTATSFSPRMDTRTGNRPRFVTSGDVDGDGKMDMVVLNQLGNTAYVYRNASNVGTLSWAPPVSYPAGTNPMSAALGDLSGDGKPDLVIGDYDSSQVVVYKNASTPGNILFTEKQVLPIAIHYNPASMGIADFDGDGRPDIAALNNNGYSVSLFRNISSSDLIRFATKVDFAVGNWPNELVIDDFNGDGKPDVAVANTYSNSVSVLENTGSVGAFSFQRLDMVVGVEPHTVSAGDLDGDGRPELIVGISEDPTFGVYKNTSTTGTLSFAPKVGLPVGTSGIHAKPHDLDGDGKLDLGILAFGFSARGLLRNTDTAGSFSFAPLLELNTGQIPNALNVGDLNGDGQPDLAYVNSLDSTLSVHLNTMRAVPLIHSFSPASGSVDSVITITGTGFAGTTAVEIGGVPVAGFTATSNSIRIVLGSGATGDVVVTTPQGTAVAPGFTFHPPAPVISSFVPESGETGSSVTLRGKHFVFGGGTPVVYFGAVRATVTSATDTTLTVEVPVGATYQPITVTVNSLTAYSSKPFRVTFPGTAAGLRASSFAAAETFLAGGNPRSIAVADFNDDGKPDLFVTNQSSASAFVYPNTSTFRKVSLGAPQELAMEVEPFVVATGDFDGDGKVDVAISNANGGYAGSVSIRRNTSTGGSISFSENITLPVGNGPRGVAVADLNADGKPDLVVTAGNSAYIVVYPNTSDFVGRISFALPVHIATMDHSDDVVLTDLDGDGKPELIAADFGSSSISVWRNTSGAGGAITLGSRVKYAAGTHPSGIRAGDFDLDGRIDIAVVNYSGNTVSVFKNNSLPGNIVLADKQDYTTGTSPGRLAIGDVDGDGRTDIIVPSTAPSAVAVLRNTSASGVLSFADRVEYAAGMQPPSVSVADLDGDSKPELVAPTDFSKIAILRNRVDEPIIVSFTPDAAEKDSLVTITGENLGGATGVSFGGTPAASFTVASDSVITAIVSGGSTGAVQVTTPYGQDSLGLFTYIPPIPVIQSFSPSSGTVGTAVRITGYHFDNTASVRFGLLQASAYTVESDTLITAIVGKGTTGNVIVTNENGSDTLSGFTFIPPVPEVSSFFPITGTEGTPVTIRGKNFTWTTAVRFGNQHAASYVVTTDSTITAVTGAGETGAVGVITEFGADSLGVFLFLEEGQIVAYPNPVTGPAMVAHPATNTSSQLKLVDINGRVVKAIMVSPNETQTRMDLTNVQPGIYRVVWSNGEKSVTQTILVN